MRRLFIRPGAIGDCILSLPELESYCGAGVSACLPAASDYAEVWAPRVILPLIQFADHTRAIADTGIELLGVIPGHRVPELETFDTIYSWYGSNRDEFRKAVRHLPFTFFPALPINVVGTPRIRVPPAPIEDFAIIHPFSGSTQKNWPLDSFREVATRLPMPSRFCAGPDDPLDRVPNDAVRIENLFDLARWISTARVYIGNDSGISHLAAAVGVPTVAIFLTTDPRIWAPRGHHAIALEHPSVDAVVAATQRIAQSDRRLLHDTR